jgi:hypothetical protein
MQPISNKLNSALLLYSIASNLVDRLIFIASGLTIILHQILGMRYLKQVP